MKKQLPKNAASFSRLLMSMGPVPWITVNGVLLLLIKEKYLTIRIFVLLLTCLIKIRVDQSLLRKSNKFLVAPAAVMIRFGMRLSKSVM